jgi:hypothetical protein
MKNWRKIDLIEGASYKLARDLSSPMGNFSCGEIVKFEGSSYSRYDSATILLFKDFSGGTKQFFLHDDSEFPKDAFEDVK